MRALLTTYGDNTRNSHILSKKTYNDISPLFLYHYLILIVIVLKKSPLLFTEIIWNIISDQNNINPNKCKFKLLLILFKFVLHQ